MRISLTKSIGASSNLVIALFSYKDLKTHQLFKTLSNEDKRYILGVTQKKELSDKGSAVLYLPSNPKRAVTILGLGDKKIWTRKKLFLASRRIVLELKAYRIESAVLSLENLSIRGADTDELANLIVQNLLMADYSFTEFRKEPKNGWPKITRLEIYSKPAKKLEKAIKEGETIGNAVNQCRALSNIPGGIMTPEKLARAAVKLGRETKVKVKVLAENDIRKLGMGGLLGVSSGSAEEPKFIVMEYGPVTKSPIVFVGKGITFDSGGIDIKPSGRATDMKMDMSGGAAVINAIVAIAKMKLNVHVVGIIPAAENMPSGSSYRPGDVLKTITGKTIQVVDTDAEGRVILADALGYAQRYKPSLIVDVATLTGAAVVALGSRTNALFSNEERLLNFGKRIGDKTGDFAWPLPVWDEYDEEIIGISGDVANLGKYSSYGGAITAAAFLKQFVGKFPWIHLDIAPMMTPIEGQYLEKGATGTGVRFLIEIAKTFK